MVKTSYSYANAAIGMDGSVLQDIHLKSKNIAIYQRKTDHLSGELERIRERTVECRATGTIPEVLSTLTDYFEEALPDSPALLQDISELFQLFVETTEASVFRLLFTTVSTNMCRKFHTDVNDLRLLCTYLGPGTNWVPDEAIDREASRTLSRNQEVVMDTTQVQQVDTGDVALLKGGLYPDATPILHRSPTIEERGDIRLLLRIDTNEFLNLLA